MFPVYHPILHASPDLWNANEACRCLFALLSWWPNSGVRFPPFYWNGKISVNSSSECRMSVRSGTFFCGLAALETLALSERRSKESRRVWTFLFLFSFYWQKSKLCLLVWSLKQMWFSPLFHGGLTYLSLIVILSPTLQIQMTDVLGLPKTPWKTQMQFSTNLRFSFCCVTSE